MSSFDKQWTVDIPISYFEAAPMLYRQRLGPDRLEKLRRRVLRGVKLMKEKVPSDSWVVEALQPDFELRFFRLRYQHGTEKGSFIALFNYLCLHEPSESFPELRHGLELEESLTEGIKVQFDVLHEWWRAYARTEIELSHWRFKDKFRISV